MALSQKDLLGATDDDAATLAKKQTSLTATPASSTPASSTKTGTVIETGMGPSDAPSTSLTGTPSRPNVPSTPDTGATTSTPTATPATNAGGGDPTYKLTDADVTSLLQQRPDIQTAYNTAINGDPSQNIPAADRNSPAFAQAGLGSVQDYARHWYSNMGGYNSWSPTGTATGGDGASQQGGDLISSLTAGFNQQIAALSKQNQDTITALNGQNQQLTGAIQGQQADFAKSQQALLDQMQVSAAKQSAAFASALKGLTDANSTSGQTAKSPNYGKALQRNKELNGTGLGSTMLTGPGGVAPGAMSLGFTSLLGS